MDRTERQELCIKRWIDAKCKGSLELATGFGKTKTALDAISKFLTKNPGRVVLVSVPTDEIKQQWIKGLADRGLFMNVQVEIINSIVKHDWTVDMLVIDKIFCRYKIYWIAGNSLELYKLQNNQWW